MAMTGLAADQLTAVVEALGFGREGERYVRAARRRPSPPRPRRKGEPGTSPFAALRQMLVNS
jgi:hypothetical protein